MQYMTAAEAAGKWGVSLRQVQRLLADKRIPDAHKYGRSWMIPAGANKPADPRGRWEKSFPADLADVIKKVYADNANDYVGEERIRNIYESGYAYLVGHYELTLQNYLKIEGDDAAKLCSSSLAMAAAISIGNYPAYLKIEKFLKGIVAAGISSDVTAYAELCLATVPTGAFVPSLAPEWLKKGDFSALPPLTRVEAAYKRAKYFLCVGNFEAMLAVAQTALNFFAPDHGFTVYNIYLRIMCATAVFGLGRWDEVSPWLLEAMDFALPNGYITPFAEAAAVYGVIMEQLLEQKYPAYIEAIHKGWQCTFTHWMEFHNRYANSNITLILTRREHGIALMAARDAPYAEIAKHYNLSPGRLNNIMQEIYEKLNITSKKELSKFVL